MVLVSDLAERKAGLRYLQVRLVGTRSNRDGLGAVVTVRAGQHQSTQVNDGKSGYLSQSRLPLYFGLGEAAAVERVEVLWPSGLRQVIKEPGVLNGLLEVTEPAE